MSKIITVVGAKYNSLCFLGIKKIRGRYLGEYKCDCGNITFADLYKVRNGLVKSCGCKRNKNISESKIKHGQSKIVNGRESLEYASWRAMKSRCHNINDKAFANYGGRGIKVCDRWNKFENFLSDMGKKPATTYTLERKDNNGDYTPTNCTWANRTIQANNQRVRSNKTGFTGVQKMKDCNRWQASCRFNGKYYYIGLYKNAVEAYKAYRAFKEDLAKSYAQFHQSLLT